MRGGMKIAIFHQYLALSLKRYKIKSLLLWNANRKPYPSFRMQTDFKINISETVQHTHVVIILMGTYALLKGVISDDFE